MSLLVLMVATTAGAAGTVAVTGAIEQGGGYGVLLIGSDGATASSAAASNGKFTFRDLALERLHDATLHLVDPQGRYLGPIVLSHKGDVARLALSGRIPKHKRTLNVGKVVLGNGAASLKKALAKTAVDQAIATAATSDGVPLGGGNSGLVTVPAAQRTGPLADATPLPGDLDGDGILDQFDVDDDGDGVLDGSDPDSAESTAKDNPFTTLYLGVGQTLNQHVAPLTSAKVDAVIGGENVFALIFFLSLPPEASPTLQAHVVCDPALVYCRATADGGSTGVSTGVSESAPSVRGVPWSDLNMDGSGYPNLERLAGRNALVASIQPRVGTTQFRAGDLYRIELTDGGAVTSTRALTLAPYFVTVPAVTAYDAGAGAQTVDYGAPAGSGSGNPIVLSGSGTLRLDVWRPQRAAVVGAESGNYRDMGHLHYGVILGGGAFEFTCAGLYSNLSSTLSEGSAGGGYRADQGGNLWPLTDAADDAAPESTTPLSFTVDLSTCLSRVGLSGGTYSLDVTAAGETLAGGANRAAQQFWVTVP